MNTVSPQWQRELERQQRLLDAIQSTGSFAALDGWAVASVPTARTATLQRRLGAYVAHAGATAERVLSAAYPTVQALVGDEAFALLARALWRRHPPRRGDVGWFGEALPGFIADDEQLADVPYLGDVARLEWALTRAESAADATSDTASFQWLTEIDPEALSAVLAPGAALITSVWPVHAVWQAHQVGAEEPDPFAAARRALQAQVAETAWVWRAGWKARVCCVGARDARFLQALTEQASLSQALNEAGADFDFAACLQQGLTQGWWLGMRRR